MLLVLGISTSYSRGGEKLRKLTRTILVLTSALISFSFAWVALLPLLPTNSSAMPVDAIVLTLVSVGIVLAIVFWSIRTQLGQSKSAEPYDGTPEQCWYGGMFYFNPNDPSILVPKRAGIGYTLNFAHPASWVFMAGVLAPLGFFLFYKHKF